MIAEKIRKISIVNNGEKNPTIASMLSLLAEAAIEADALRNNGQKKFELSVKNIATDTIDSETDIIVTDNSSAPELRRAISEFGLHIPILVISTLKVLDFNEQTTKEELGLKPNDKVISIEALFVQSLTEIIDTYFETAAA